MMMLTDETRIDNVLEELGYRVTGPRRKVARLVSTKEGTFSAESINDGLPSVGRATVYRTLKLLSETGILCKITLPDGSPRYSLDGAWHHHHVICSPCGKIEEFRKPVLERLLREMASEVDGKMLGHRVEVYITCADCLPGTSPGDN
ncbi:MAG: Fur family transcriptional regulator [Chloroflexi bacterium]|nr:Fur family transcriptional regulator [Chloroflexota bacterium]